MITRSLFVRLWFTAMMFFVWLGANAQVTIGSSNPPSDFSLLDLDASVNARALHLPRLTSSERDALVSSSSTQPDQGLAVGLMIYNTDNNCLEFWNGIQWISFCDGDTPDPCAGFGTMSTFFCSGATIADLTQRAIEAGGNGSIRWFAAASGGTALDPDTELIATEYFADNCAGAAYRIPVLVSLANCNDFPTVGSLTAWTNAMYDFQTQTLSFVGADDAISWQWQVWDGTTQINGNLAWQDISGATSATFTIPAGFMYSSYTGIAEGTSGQAPSAVAGSQVRELGFRVVRTDAVGTTTNTATFNMLFIRTNTSGYGAVNGVLGLVMNRAPEGGAGSGNPDTLRIALLNVGATNDNSLGDFYQWGRRADGHQTIVWDKNPSGANVFGSGTSGTVANTNVTMANLDSNGQVLPTATGFGSFLISDGVQDWVTDVVYRDNLWGDGLTVRPGTSWTFPTNDPCPAGWRVITRWEFSDMNSGTGVGNPSGNSWGAHNNTWIWRPTTNGAVGGAIITNQNGEVLFLPAAGARGNNGLLSTMGTQVRYWSSTAASPTVSWVLHGAANVINVGSSNGPRGAGWSVRCVAE